MSTDLQLLQTCVLAALMYMGGCS